MKSAKLRGKVVITGAAGFIGSQIASQVRGDSSILVDKLSLFRERGYNASLLKEATLFEADGVFLQNLESLTGVNWIIHMGAITNTAEQDKQALQKWNVEYSKAIWNYCTKNDVGLIYASSAATYGSGQNGFSDDYETLAKLEPLNPYGQSKHEFDLWVLEQIQAKNCPSHWYGLKFFNVYGPNEGHKGRMASSIWHGYNEIQSQGKMTLFKSHNPKFKDGAQARDFIYVRDILNIIEFLIEKTPASAIYNCGTGRASTFLDLAQGLFIALKKPLKINWIETPQEFRAAYQYRTEAIMDKLRNAGYTQPFTPLTEAINNYLDSLVSYKKNIL